MTTPHPDDDALLSPEPGWTPLGDWPFLNKRPPGRFVSGDPSGTRFRLRYYRDAAAPHVCHGKIIFGPGAEGPPLHAHGGAIAALLDEALGITCWFAGHPVTTAQLNTRFIQMVPLNQVIWLESRIEDEGGEGRRSVQVRGRLFNPETGEDYASATATFVRLSPRAVEIFRKKLASRSS